MNVRDIRRKTGLTQKAFSAHYHIPLQTLKQWESSSHSASHRVPPEYVLHMLQRLAKQDFSHAGSKPLSREENPAIAAQESMKKKSTGESASHRDVPADDASRRQGLTHYYDIT